MKPEQFIYWLQGFSEICGGAPTEDQWKVIQEHLNTCFNKVTTVTPLVRQTPVTTLPSPSVAPDLWRLYPNTYIPTTSPFDKNTPIC